MRLAAENGTANVTMQAVAAELGAPSGSLYHRYPTRDHLLADLWLRSVGAFQQSLFERLEHCDDALEAACAAATHVVGWCRRNPVPAKILLLFSVTDLKEGSWPAEIKERADGLNNELGRRIRRLARDLGATSSEDRLRLRMCVFDLPYGVVRNRLQGDEPIRAIDERLVGQAVETILRSAHR